MDASRIRPETRAEGIRARGLGSPTGRGAAASTDRAATRSASRAVSARVLFGTIIGLVAAAALILSCSPDLREATGPITPYPNVEGNLSRDGRALFNHRVRLIDSVSDSTMHKTHTNLSGHYGFAHVGTGSWTIKIASDGPPDTTEFSEATYDFVFTTPDTSIVLPGIDLGVRGASLVSPPSGAVIPPPSFFSPVTFQWNPCSNADIAEVRVFDSASSEVWISGRTTGSTAAWNGLCNQGANSGHPAPPGDYVWRLRFRTGGTSAPVEYTTLSRPMTLQGAAP